MLCIDSSSLCTLLVRSPIVRPRSSPRRPLIRSDQFLFLDLPVEGPVVTVGMKAE